VGQERKGEWRAEGGGGSGEVMERAVKVERKRVEKSWRE
jgi:hypothetical protein